MTEDIILQYISGSLKGEALDLFEAQLKKDKNLQSDLALYQEMVSYAGSKKQIKKSVDVLKDVGEEFRPAKVVEMRSKPNPVRRFFIPTAVAAIFLIGIFILPLLQSSSNSALIDESYFAVSPLSFSSRSAEANIIYEHAAKAFNNEDYDKALEYLSTVIAGDPNNMKAQFYKGITLMRLGNQNSAREVFKTLIDHPLYVHASQYHTGLSYLTEENFEPAKTAFESIPDSSNYYNKAQKLLSKNELKN